MEHDFKHYRKGERQSAAEYNRAVDTLAGIAKSLHIQGFEDSTGFHSRRQAGGILTGGEARVAFCKDNAEAKTTIDCYLDVDITGDVIPVKCNTSPKNTNLDKCIRRLKAGDLIIVQKIGDDWYASEGFQAIDKTKGLDITSDKLAAQIDTNKGVEFSSGKVAAKLDESEMDFEGGGISTKLAECS